MRIYTRKGDDGTTGLLYGTRVAKDSPRIELNGAVDEAQAALGVARAEAGSGSELDELLIVLERDLWVLMAEVATAPGNRHKLKPGTSLVTEDMVTALEGHIDALSARTVMPKEFVVPGHNRTSALLDVARTVIRRAERLVVADEAAHGLGDPSDPSMVGPYLNRLSDLVWTMARWQEGDVHLAARSRPRRAKGAATKASAALETAATKKASPGRAPGKAPGKAPVGRPPSKRAAATKKAPRRATNRKDPA